MRNFERKGFQKTRKHSQAKGNFQDAPSLIRTRARVCPVATTTTIPVARASGRGL